MQDTFATAIEKKTRKEYEVITPSMSEYYSHPTFIISSLADYIRLITTISAIGKNGIDYDTVVYRGMSDIQYDLLPGIARLKNLDSDTESMLIRDFLIRRPDAFSGLSEFDTIAKMQHYGLPTRLLDFSLNPLVALYFACETSFFKDGRVLCHGTFLKNDSSEFVNTICTSVMKKDLDENCTIDDYLFGEALSLRKYMTEAYLYNETTVVRPKYWNQRITNQAGVFMVFPNNLRDRYRYIFLHAEELGLEKAIHEYGRGKINAEIIETALQVEPIEYYKSEKDSILTNECFRKMVGSYKDFEGVDEFWQRIKNRFTITCETKPLDHAKISNRFCSIIIEGKNKKKILKDLSYVGFGVDYIYPELEYTAKEIKRKYE